MTAESAKSKDFWKLIEGLKSWARFGGLFHCINGASGEMADFEN
jgi:hypothetical protein